MSRPEEPLLAPARALNVTARSLRAVLRRVESMGLRGTERHWGLMPAEVARRLRPRIERVGDGLLTLLQRSDALRLNRVIGLGHRGLATEPMIDRIVETYREAGLRRFSLLMSPGPQERVITGWLAARGLRRHGGNSLLVRDARRPLPRVSSAVRIARARREQAEVVVEIGAKTFGLAASRRPWVLAAAAAPGSEHFLGFAGRNAVASGVLSVERDLAWLGGGATLPRWRRLGAHAALIAARLRRARRRGCRWAWVETAPFVPGRPGGSRRNMLRLGFVEACVKPLYVWSESAPRRPRARPPRF